MNRAGLVTALDSESLNCGMNKLTGQGYFPLHTWK